MSFDITIGWWIIPLLITIGFFIWANTRPKSGGSGMYSGLLDGFFENITAIIVSLVSWLIYFVIF